MQEVVQHLSQLIQNGQLQPGDKLPTESAIMGDMQVSRTVVREAISRLQASGQVETRHGIGTFVIETPATDNFRIAEQDMATVDDVIAVLELRISLETEAAGLAAERASPEQLTAMAQAFLKQARALSPRSVRLLLTGHADFPAVQASVNECDVFRYVAKPWDSASLLTIVADAMRAARALQDQPPVPATAADGGAAAGAAEARLRSISLSSSPRSSHTPRHSGQ